MNFRGLKLNKRTKITCLALLAIDLLFVFWSSLVHETRDGFLLMIFALIFKSCTVITGLAFLFLKEKKIIGICLLANIFVVMPCVLIVGNYIVEAGKKSYELWVMSGDFCYEMDYKGKHRNIILYGEKHAEYESKKKFYGEEDRHCFKIFDDISLCEGKYKQIGENHYMLICDLRDFSEINCKDTLILRNDTLYNYFDKPVKVVKK